jgi:hypothetical protein
LLGRRGRVSVTGGQLRLGLFAAVFVLLIVNAMAPWSDTTSGYLYLALQAVAGVGALACGLVVAHRVTGAARAWRLLVVAGFVSWLIAEGLWLSAHAETGTVAAPWPSVAAYFLPPLLSGNRDGGAGIRLGRCARTAR